MDKELQLLYNDLLKELVSGNRGTVSLGHEHFSLIHSQLSKEYITQSLEDLEKYLCLLTHSTKSSTIFDKTLTNLIRNLTNIDHIVMALGAFEHITIQRKMRNSDRILPDEVKLLKELLAHENIEVVSWSLRLIEGLGGQAIHFKKDLANWKRPSLIQNPFNANYKAVKSLISYINKRFEGQYAR